MTDDAKKLHVLLRLEGALPDRDKLNSYRSDGFSLKGELTWPWNGPPVFCGSLEGKVSPQVVLNILDDKECLLTAIRVICDGESSPAIWPMPTLSSLKQALPELLEGGSAFVLRWGDVLVSDGVYMTAAILDMPIEQFLKENVESDYSFRIINSLNQESLLDGHYVGDLVCVWTEKSLMLIPNFGRKSLHAVKLALAPYGLKLGETVPVVKEWQRPA
jgi:hypothetical protein